MNIAEQIVTFPHDVLLKKATSITKNELKGELKTILMQVKKYIEEDKGAAGLALPQIGISKRAFVAKLMLNEKEIIEIFINPRIKVLRCKHNTEIEDEGCLSIPNEQFEVERFRKVQIVYQNINGKGRELTLYDWNARVVQHELDHLNGVLISQIGENVTAKVAQ